MKSVRKILITYTALMLAALGVLYLGFQKAMLKVEALPSYTDEELRLYRKIWNAMNESMFQNRQTMFLYIFLFWLAILILGYTFLFVTYWTLVKPVREMEKYATEIAKGNLDVELPMHKNNLFGSFTESFSLMREELKASRQREIAAEKAKREMVAELSHDLKTPVATIQATCEVLEVKQRKRLETLTEEEAKKDAESTLEKIGVIHNKTQMIGQLVGNVFRATLDDMEEIKVETSEVPAGMITGFFQNLKEYGNIILENAIPECLVRIDPLRMEQVIDNIVGNAYKYAGTDVRVRFDEVEIELQKRERFIKITIRDEGPGVPESDLPLVTEKFYRGSDTKAQPGYGLGLYLVKTYMERQGGGMEYYNDNGFVVELLVKKV